MKIGFTGTQKGMTENQKIGFSYLIKYLNIKEFAHGDCIGADANAHDLVFQYFTDCLKQDLFRGKIVIHPPINPTKRAFCKSREIRECLPYIDRNHNIVDECKILIGTPKGYEEELRSGTWATLRYAKRISRSNYIIYPDGSIDETIRN